MQQLTPNFKAWIYEKEAFPLLGSYWQMLGLLQESPLHWLGFLFFFNPSFLVNLGFFFCRLSKTVSSCHSNSRNTWASNATELNHTWQVAPPATCASLAQSHGCFSDNQHPFLHWLQAACEPHSSAVAPLVSWHDSSLDIYCFDCHILSAHGYMLAV